jgi:hypothetical protein
MEFTTTQQRIAAIPRQQVLKKPVFVAALTIFGVFSSLAGIISLATAVILSSNASMPSLGEAMLIDAAYEFILGALIFASTRAFTKGSLLSVWFYGASLVLDCLYNLLTGQPLNFMFLGFGLLLIWQILQFRNELELS